MFPLFSPPWLDSSRTSLVVVTSGDGKGVKIDYAILVPKAGTSVPKGKSGLVSSVVLGSEPELIVRSCDGMGFVYSSLMSSPSEVENVDS